MASILRLLLALFVAGLLTANLLSAQDKPVLTWFKMDDPPDFITTGPHKGQGVQDLVMKYFQTRLPGYTHREEVIIFPRILSELKAGTQAISLGFFRTTERKEFMLFSEAPSGIFFPLSLIISATNETIPEFRPPVEFERLVTNKKLVGGLAAGRSYGEYLDDVLKRAEPGTQLFTRAGGDLFPGLYQMLIARRVDYVLGSSLEAAYAQKTYGGTIRVLPISGELDYAVGYAGYPKTPFGQKLADQMEVLLDKAWHDPAFLSIYTSLLDEPNRKIFNREVQKLVH